MLKINVDASVIPSMNYFGVGIDGRYFRGHVMFAEGLYLPRKLSPKVAEFRVVFEGMKLALNLGWSKVLVDGDALQVIQGLYGKDPFSPDGHLIDCISKIKSSFRLSSLLIVLDVQPDGE